MSPLSPLAVNPLSATAPKETWEDPCITLERDLEARAQVAPPNPQNQFAPHGVLGPLSVPTNCS